MKYGQNLTWFLSELSLAEPEQFETGSIEIIGENEQGQEGSVEVEVPDLALAAKNRIEELEARLKAATNKSRAEAVMGFVNVQLGAFESNFIETNQVSLYSMYRFAQHHIKDNYGEDIKNLADVFSEEFANECRSPEEITQ